MLVDHCQVGARRALARAAAAAAAALAIAAAPASAQVSAARLLYPGTYGNYCGPKYCCGRNIEEGQCFGDKMRKSILHRVNSHGHRDTLGERCVRIPC